MTSSEQTMREAKELLRRVSPAARDLARRQRMRRQQAIARRFRRVLTIAIAAAIGWAVVSAIFSVALLSWLLMTVIAFVAILFFGMLLHPRTPEPSAEKLMETELPALPSRTEEWLAGQRAALPPPASKALGEIATRLEELRPQLANLDPREPAAIEVRRLVGVELPELVEGYKRVPAHLRREDNSGRSPEQQLVDGLDIVESEISRMTRQLAAGELDALATQGKFLELKYRGDEELGEER